MLFFVFFGVGKAQTFQSEEDIKHPVKMPLGILRLLKKTEQVASCVRSEELESAAKLDRSWFQAATVKLNGDRFTDYVVKNVHPCLNGPRAASWWIFRGGPKGFVMVMEETVLTLTIKKTKTAGFRDIQTETAMMRIIRNQWKYDSRKYKLKSTKFIEVGK